MASKPVWSDDSLLVLCTGWRFQLVPSTGPFAGQPITRCFVGPNDRDRATSVARHRYGQDTHFLAGRSLDGNSEFGDWDD